MRGGRPLTLTEHAIATTIVAVLAAVATASLYGVTEQWNFAVPTVIGAAVALVVCVASRWKALLVGETIVAAAIVFVLVGAGVGGGGVPGPSGFEAFFGGLTRGWSDLLSSTAPTDMTAELRIVPYSLAFVGTLIGAEVLRRISQPGLPVIGPLAVLALTTLLTVEDRAISLAIGAILAGGALAVGFIQQRALRTARTSDYVAGSTRSIRTTATVASVALVAVAAPMLGPVLPGADTNDRYGLRDDVVPPWDPLALPSPLTQLKAPLEAAKDGDEPLPIVFTVTSADEPTRFATSVLGAHDGVVFTVGSGIDEAASEFRPVGTRMPDPPDEIGGDRTVTATVTIEALSGPWVPSPGWPETLDLAPREPAATGADLTIRENINTGTLAVPGGLAGGTTYEITARLPEELSDEQLADHAMRALPATNDDLAVLQPQIKNLSADILEGLDPGWEQIAAIRDKFIDEGFYSIDESALPGHSYYRIERFLEDPDRIFGYEEQYVAASALIGRLADLPTRVVVGYEIPADRYENGVAEIRQDDITAWLEARVDDVGWVPVDVTPEQPLEPERQQEQSVPDEAPAPNPPPPPPPPPQIDVAPDNEEDEADEEEDEEDDHAAIGATFPGPAIRPYVVAGAGGSGGLLVLLAALIIGFKALRSWRRRRQREPARRIAGAWHELADRYHEAGVPVPPKATPLEAARAFLVTEPSAPHVYQQLRGLVGTVDRSAWHQVPPQPGHAQQAWDYCDVVLRTLVHDRSWPQRVKMRLDPRPLWHRDVWRKAQRGSTS